MARNKTRKRHRIAPQSFFLKWRDQPASEELPEAPALYEEQEVSLSSNLIGCHVTVKSKNVSPCIELAESIIAALESLLSTATVQHMALREPTLSVSVNLSDFAEDPFEFELKDETGRPHFGILCSPVETHSMTVKSQQNLKEKLLMLLARVLGRIVMTENTERFLEALLRDERALDRSLNFSGSFMTVANVLGPKPKNRISDWRHDKITEFPSKRREAWDANHRVKSKLAIEVGRPIRYGSGQIPTELRDLSRVKQGEIINVSLIRETLWDQAKWTGTAFATGEEDNSPPIMALMFKNPVAAKQIFRFWESELGAKDEQDRLRVVIVRGISMQNPYWYRILIGSNLGPAFRTRGIKYFVSANRINTMNPESPVNLERFLRSYEKHQKYLLAAVELVSDGREARPIDSPSLVKCKLTIKQAWEIGRHDPDGVVVLPEDSPVIPPDRKTVPVTELLHWKQSRSQDGQSENQR